VEAATVLAAVQGVTAGQVSPGEGR
jgi:hypothetical protein